MVRLAAAGVAGGRVSARTKLGFASGALEESMITAAAAVTMLYYNQVLGVPAPLCGAAFLIAAIVDAISDPLVGALSDQVRTRWGRRHPLMALSAIPIAACFFALYQPPAALGERGLFLWLTASLVGLGIAKDFFALPHMALGAELSDDYMQRTAVFGWNWVLGALGSIGIGVVIYALIFPSQAGFDNGLLDASRYPLLATFGAALVLAAVLCCTISTVDQIPRLRAHQAVAGQTRRRLGEVVHEIKVNARALATNQSYLAVCLCWLVLAVSGGVLAVVGPYANLYGLGFTTEQLAGLRLVTLPGLLVCVPLSAYLTRRFDKKMTVIWMIVISCLMVGAPHTLKLLGLFPPSGSPASLPVFFLLQAVGFVALPIVPIVINSQLADIADEHELRTGNRAEGLIFSARLFAVKASNGIGAVLGGLGLDFIDFPRHARAADLAPNVVQGLMFMMGPLYYLIVFGGLGFALLYRLDRKSHGEILARLEAQRRGAGLVIPGDG